MQKSFTTKDRRSLLFSLLFLGLVAALIFVPAQFISKAGGGGNGKGLVQRTESLDEGIVKMYDIREDKTQIDTLADFRSRIGRNAVDVADQREKFVRGEEHLKQQLPTAKVEYNLDIRTPEVITPDVYAARVQWLTQPSTAKRADILRNFVKEHNLLVGLDNAQVDGLKNVADYTNPDGNLSYVHLEQQIKGVPVFRGEVKAGFTQNNEIIRVINNLAPGLDYEALSTDFRNPADAVTKAAAHINHELRPEDTTYNDRESNNLKAVFGSGDWATTAEKMYFPTEPGIAVPAWRVLIWRPVNAYYVIVDAETGIVLWHKNIADDQTQSATYNVYANAASYINTADHAAALSPYGGPSSNPGTGTQGPLGTRSNQTLIGNEGPLSFNQLGWINDNTNITDGNSNEAGVDRVAPNGVDAPMVGDTACPGAGCRTFTSTWNPPPGMPAPGDEPLTPQAQRGAVIQMFWIMNKYHDELYLRGFTEAARNFQNVNFTGMGIGNDRVSSEGQDSSGTNNANFATPADGGRGRMQMYLWSGPTPDRDGTADADIVIHEVTHGTSNRLHGNGSGLGNQGGMMGEGWSDWYAHVMLSEPTDAPNGVYGIGGYSLFNLAAGFTANYYYGIRRFPTAIMASTGGPNNRPHNPLTFGHLNAGCDTTLGTTTNAVSSAYPRNPVIATSGNCSQVHNGGEIWKSALWEVRHRLITRLGWAEGTRRSLQVVTDGMKLAPLNPNMLQERDAIIAAATALPAVDNLTGADALDVREGFRIRGMGFSASVQSATAVTEAFDAPTVGGGAATVTSGNNLLEPNECNTLNVAINNNSSDNATNISAVLSSNTPGITVTQNTSAYPNIPGGGQGVNNTTPYQVSIDNTVACFTTASFTLTITYTGGGGGSPLAYNFSLPVGIPGNAYTFTAGTGTIPAGGTLVTGSTADDAAVTLTLPAGWTSSIYGVAVTSLSASTNGMITANGAAATTFANTALPAAVGGTNPTLFPLWDDYDMDPADTVGGGIYTNTIGTAPNRQFVVEWRATHFAETTTAISTNFAVVLTEGTPNIRYIYTLTGVGAQANGVSATVGVQRQSTGTQFTQVSFNMPVIMPGTDRTGTLPAGQCTPGSGPCGGPVAPENPRADFDGDGKTDLSVYRPSEGNWYLQRSTAGFGVINWGNATDTLVPGDFDGDGKADTAVFRPDANAANNDFYVLRSNGFTFQGTSWGVPGDVPVNGDYNGDNRDDHAIFRPSTNTWYILNSGSGANTIEPFGSAGDIPLSMDDNGDGRAQISVYRPSNNTWYVAKPTGTPATNFTAYPYGTTGDRQVHADYDGDNKDDVAVFRPSNGTWYIRRSSNGNTDIVPFGSSGDVPVPGDYDGDGKDDVAVYRAGTWYVNRSTGGLIIQNFGLGSDIAIPNRYLPTAPAGGGSAGTLQFSAATYTVSEAGPTATITVTRTGGSTGAVSAAYATSNGTATGGAACGGAVDFVNANGTVNFADGVTTAQTFTVTICNDTTVEPSETINLALSGATGGATIGTPAAAVLTITDNDGGGSGTTVSYTGAAVAIPDNLPAGVNINLPVTGAGTVADLNFRFDTLAGATCDGTTGDTDCAINHTWVGDIIIKVTPPDGSPTVTIFDRPGVPGTTTGCSNNNIGDILLNDEGGFPSVDLQGNPTPTACNTAFLFPTGNFSPFSPLSALDGENSEGTWVINVSDNAGLDTGSVRRFSLVFNSGN
jgi:hypothetical protein